MYICHCNALTDHDVRRALGDGASRVSEVYAAAGCKADCGGCAGTIVSMVRTFRSGAAAADGLMAGSD